MVATHWNCEHTVGRVPCVACDFHDGDHGPLICPNEPVCSVLHRCVEVRIKLDHRAEHRWHPGRYEYEASRPCELSRFLKESGDHMDQLGVPWKQLLAAPLRGSDA